MILPKHHTSRILAAAVGGAVCLLAGAGSAAAVVPGSNGKIVASKCEDGDGGCDLSHIWTIDPATGAEHPVTTDASYWDDDPAVSPDGKRVAFQHCPAGGKCRIAIVGIGGGSVANLTPGTDYEDYPAFSPDGSRIVFSRNDPAGGVRLVVMDATGGSERPLTGGSTDDDSRASWSPDGSTIAFERRVPGVGTHIRKVPASGGPTEALTAGTADYSPSFSPDGARIAFSSGQAIQAMDSSGANRHALTAPGALLMDGEPAFSPDGTQIVFERYSQGVPHTSPLLVMNADGSDQHLISGPDELLWRADWQAIHPEPAPAPEPSATTVAAQAAAGAGPAAVTLAAPHRQSVRRGALHLFATSSEPARALARGRVALPGRAKSHRLRPAAKQVPANTRTRIRLSIPRSALSAIRTALSRGAKPRARIVVAVKDGAGNVTTESLTIRLRR